jgi:hypothetical protein
MMSAMTRLRFSIASLLALVLHAAVAIAALREANMWHRMLLASVLLAASRTERRWAYGAGFAVFGSAYLVASLGPGGTSVNFMRIGRSLLALVLAFLAGHIYRLLIDREISHRGEGPADSSQRGPTSTDA